MRVVVAAVVAAAHESESVFLQAHVYVNGTCCYVMLWWVLVGATARCGCDL